LQATDGRWSERTIRRARICGLQIKDFVGDRELFSQQEIDRDPIYGDRCKLAFETASYYCIEILRRIVERFDWRQRLHIVRGD